MRREVDDFLTECRAIPAPAEAYALWLMVYLINGGSVARSRDSSFISGVHGVLMPTRSTSRLIPTSYGALSVRLLIPANVIDVSEDSTSGDSRPGWEWGHSTVYRLGTTLSGELVATTNNPRDVDSFLDIERIIRAIDQNEIERYVRRMINQHGARVQDAPAIQDAK
jgi:hypothetical protein